MTEAPGNGPQRSDPPNSPFLDMAAEEIEAGRAWPTADGFRNPKFHKAFEEYILGLSLEDVQVMDVNLEQAVASMNTRIDEISDTFGDYMNMAEITLGGLFATPAGIALIANRTSSIGISNEEILMTFIVFAAGVIVAVDGILRALTSGERTMTPEERRKLEALYSVQRHIHALQAIVIQRLERLNKMTHS